MIICIIVKLYNFVRYRVYHNKVLRNMFSQKNYNVQKRMHVCLK